MADSTGILGSLGVNGINMFWQLVNFAILLFVLNKVLYKPILNKLDERARLVKDGMKAAEENLEKQRQADEDRRKLLADTRKEVDKMIAKAKQDANETKADILFQAKKEAEKAMAKKQAEIDDMLAKQEKELQNKVSDLSVSIARKVLGQYLNPENQKQLLDSQLETIAKSKFK